MGILFTWLGKAMGDGENPSAMRLIAVTSVPLLAVVPMVVWAVLSLSQGKLLEFPSSVTAYSPLMATTILAALHLNKRVEEEKK